MGGGKNKKKPARRVQPDVGAMLVALDEESPRGCALVAAAWLEHSLECILTIVFTSTMAKQPRTRGEPTERVIADLFFGHNEPIFGGAAARVTMCRLLGLIDDDLAKALKDFFHFRNYHSAHFSGLFSFDHDIDGMFADLAKIREMVKTPPSPLAISPMKSTGRKAEFMDIAFWLAIKLGVVEAMVNDQYGSESAALDASTNATNRDSSLNSSQIDTSGSEI